MAAPKGIFRAHGTHCGRFLHACFSAICTALLEDIVANTKGRKKKVKEKISSGPQVGGLAT